MRVQLSPPLRSVNHKTCEKLSVNLFFVRMSNAQTHTNETCKRKHQLSTTASQVKCSSTKPQKLVKRSINYFVGQMHKTPTIKFVKMSINYYYCTSSCESNTKAPYDIHGMYNRRTRCITQLVESVNHAIGRTQLTFQQQICATYVFVPGIIPYMVCFCEQD